MSEHIPSLILVNEEDCHIGAEEKMRTHELGLLHRAFSVFIFRTVNSELETLVQQRAGSKYHSPLLWSNTCCGHPTINKSLEACAHERLMEEMGLTASLSYLGSFRYTAKVSNTLIENEIDHLFVGIARSAFSPNPEEVENCQWVSWDKLSSQLVLHPSNFTAWFKLAKDAILEKLKGNSLINFIQQMEST